MWGHECPSVCVILACAPLLRCMYAAAGVACAGEPLFSSLAKRIILHVHDCTACTPSRALARCHSARGAARGAAVGWSTTPRVPRAYRGTCAWPRPRPSAQRFTLQQLQVALGDRIGPWLYQVVRGVEEEPVKERDKAKSCLAFKSFSPVPNLSALEKWVCRLS